MKKILLILFIFLPAILKAEYFHVENYNVNVIINKDSSVLFTETILVNFHTKRHGIYRYIPLKWGSYRFYFKIIDIKTSDDGNYYYNATYKKWKKGNWIYIRIGKKNRLIKGLKYYRIKYIIYNAIINNQFYWNVIGTGWDVPIYRANVTIKFPENIDKSLLKVYAYKGIRYSRAKCDFSLTDSSLKIRDVSLKNREGITVRIFFPEGFIHPPSKFKIAILWFKNNFGYFIPLIFLIVIFIIWLKIGKDEPKGSITVQYYPPEGFTAGEAGTLIDDTVDKKDIVATIVELAVKGYLRINKHEKKILFLKKDDFIFERTEKPADDLKLHEKIILNGIFKYGEKSVKLSDLKKTFPKTVQDFTEKMFNFLSNKEHLYEIKPNTIKKIFRFSALFIAWIGIISGNLFKRTDIVTGMMSSAIIVFLFSYIMPKKSHKGTKIYRHILGFKEFIKKVEKPVLEKLLKKDPDFFNKILPYAIAFGLEKVWTKKFEGLQIAPPTWYAGTYISTSSFVDSLHNDLSSLTSAISSTTSSGSGGGFSGGGGGGGGGGSW